MYCKFLLLVFLFFVHHNSLGAQPVVFNQVSDLLNPITGFANYADCIADMNGDYLDDVVRVGGKGIFIDYQQVDGSFKQQQFHMPVQSLPTWSICAGDIDNNRLNDLLFASNATVSFFKAIDAGNAFEEAVMPVPVESQRSTMADINNDGWLDGFVCHDGDLSIPFRNLGSGVMVPDTNLIHTADRPGNYAAIWVDYDNDGDIDLYLSKCLGETEPGDINRTNLLYRNNGDGSFSEVGAQAGVDDNAQSWSTSFEDFDNDGDFDAFVVNHDFANRLYRNNGDGTFTDVILNSGIDPFDLLAFENSSGDFNNDGYVDIFAELNSALYLGNGDLTFTGQVIPIVKGGIGDLNNDGFLDIIHESKPWLNAGNANHFVKVNTHGIQGNKNGIGSRIEIYGSWGRQIREVRSGQSFSPMSSLTTHFGLGQFDHIDSLIVRWPSGIVTSLYDIPGDTTYVIPEAVCVLPMTRIMVDGELAICPGDTTQLALPASFTDYAWSTADTTQRLLVTTPGLYAATMTDSAGCKSITEFIRIRGIVELPPSIHSESGKRICHGDTIILTSSRGDNYSWSNGITGRQSIAVTNAGAYTVAVDALCRDDQLMSDPFVVDVLDAPPPVISEIFLLPGDSILLFALGTNVHWFDQPAGGELLNTGSSYQTPSLDSSMIYYVESHHLYPEEMQVGGKIDTFGGGGLPLQGGHLFFEALEPFTLVSVDVYVPEGAPQGIRFIQLMEGDSLLAIKQFPVQTGLNILELSFEIPVGAFSLRCEQGNLFRNTGSLNYPYAIGNVGRVTGSSSGENYYYYFYNWKILKPEIECISERIPYPVIVSSQDDIESHEDFRVYPNPAKDVVYVGWLKQKQADLEVKDILGRTVFRKMLEGENHLELNLNYLQRGLYIFQITEGSRIYTKSVLFL